jgi:hypothetical protein
MKLISSHPLGISPRRYDVDKDGVNASLLGRWLSCRELARLYLLGWTPRRIGAGRIFGIIVHGVLERIYSDIQNGELESLPSTKRVKREIAHMEKVWKRQNPRADADTLQLLELNLLLAESILPVYFKFWHEDISRMDWYALERKFKVAIGDTHLIGRMDGNFKPTKGKKVYWLFETKSKSRMGEHGETNLVDTLPHDLQVNLYLGAMVAMYDQIPGGLLMNIVRRPGFRLKKGEGPMAFAKRVAADVKKRPEYYFVRIRMSIDKADLARTEREHLAMVADFMAWSKGKGHHYRNSGQCENKYGTCEYLKVCSAGDYTGLYQREARVRKDDVEVEG